MTAIVVVGVAGPMLLTASPGAAAAGAGTASDVQVDVPYGDHPEQTLDVHLPDEEVANRAAIVIIHGGAWIIGDKSDYDELAAAFADAGFTVFNVNYRLAIDTDDPWPDELLDVQAAVAWVADRAGAYSIERDRIGVYGGSAGGNLAALVGTLGTEGDPVADPLLRTPAGFRPAAVVTWSGIFDLPAAAFHRPEELPECNGNVECLTAGDRSLPGGYLECDLLACPERWIAASPISHVGPETAPMFLVNSREEIVPLSQPESMLERLERAGVPNRHLFLSGDDHFYPDRALAPTIEFFEQRLGVASTATADYLVPAAIAVLLVVGLAGVATAERRRAAAE